MDLLEFGARFAEFFIPFLFALCFHEYAHGFVAKMRGDNTAEMMGRLTMNPLAHMDPIGTFLLPLLITFFHIPFLFGWAKPVPVNSRNFKNIRTDMFWVALAGPASNILLATISCFVLVAVARFSLFVGYEAAIISMLKTFIMINLFLAFFNLIPVNPLDGGKIIARFLPASVNYKLDQHHDPCGDGCDVMTGGSVAVPPGGEKPITRVMAGARTSGVLHIGHYFGAIRNFLELQSQYQCYFGAMDWHGMTTNYKVVSDIPGWNRDMIAEFIAWGVDPEKSTLFIQSEIPEHLELFFIFANLTPMGWLERVPTWKDAEEEAKANDTHNLGRFSYPVLQAADIALYFGQGVPVGADQVAHLELSREIVRRFNHLYKGRIPEPRPMLTETPLVPGLDGYKMSKSRDNGVSLADEPKNLAKKIKAMPTDPQRARRENPGDPDKCNVNTYHKLFSSNEDLAWVHEGCTTAGIGCGDCKARLIDNMEKLMAEPRNRKKELLNKPQELDAIIRAGNDKARAEARRNLMKIKEWMKLK